MRGEFPQCLHFFVRDIGPFVFLEPEDEEPPATLVGRNQGSGTAALSSTSEPNPLLHDPTTQIGVNQALDHFNDSYAKCTVGQFGFPHPATEVPSLEYTLHVRIVPLGGIDCLAPLGQRAFSGQLTAKWREAHMKELLAELEQQARLLNLPLPIEREALA
jgi:hypothetical protein